VVLSPDGKKIAFVAIGADSVDRIFVRSLDNKDAKPLSGTETASYPFWSPDGESLGFYSGGRVRRVALGGGPIIDICGAARFRGGSWGPHGIVFAPDVTNVIFRVDANAGATPVSVTKLASDQTTHRWPQMLPDGNHFLYLAANHSDPTSSRNGIFFAALDGTKDQFVVSAESNAAYADGYLLWEQGGSLLAQRFDPSSGTLSGETAALAGSVGYNPSTWRAAFDAAANGVLVYQPGLSSDSGQLLVFGADGKSVALPDSGGFVDVRISPDGRKIAAVTNRSGHDLWVLDLEQGTRVRFTFAYTTDGIAWSADGKYLYYGTVMKPNRIMRKALDASEPEKTIFESPDPVHVSDASPDGRYLLIAKQYGKIPTTTFLLPLSAGATPKPISSDDVSAITGVFSLDSKWILYASTETGHFELYVTPAGGGQKQQLTTTGAALGSWAADGKTIFFANPDGSVYALPIAIQGNDIQAGKPRRLFSAGGLVPTTFHSRSWDATRDGRRFVVNVTGETFEQSRAVLLTNWPARLKK
jgi:Tol biopolymer transport system component